MMEHTIQTLTVDAYSSDGAGVARLDGAAVFVAGGGPDSLPQPADS